MTPEIREVFKAIGLTDEEIDILMANMEKDWEESMRNMMVDGTAHPDPNSGPPSHFGGEIGGKIPFEGLKGLNRKETATKVLTIPKTGTWWVGGTLLMLNKGDEIAWIDGGYSDEAHGKIP